MTRPTAIPRASHRDSHGPGEISALGKPLKTELTIDRLVPTFGNILFWQVLWSQTVPNSACAADSAPVHLPSFKSRQVLYRTIISGSYLLKTSLSFSLVTHVLDI